MYLDYRVHIVDDDYERRNKGEQVAKLRIDLENAIASKGFNPVVKIFKSIAAAKLETATRIDYFLSDENLDDTESGTSFYHEMRKSDAFCDFILYSRINKEQIIQKQIDELARKQDPNLFSRFSFVARETDDAWINHVIEIVEHSLSKREQMNTLRAIFAHETSKIDAALKTYYKNSGSNVESEKFAATINRITHLELKNNLHEIRRLRNGLVHNNEVSNPDGLIYIPYQETGDLPQINSLKFDLSQASRVLSLLKTTKSSITTNLGFIVD